MKKIAWLLFLLCLQVGVFADLVQYDILPLKLETGARYSGLGNSGSSIAYDAGAVFYNPGALPWSKGLSFTIKDASNISAGEAYPTGTGATFGIGALVNSSLNVHDASGNTASTSSNALVLSAASRLDSMISIPGYEKILKNTGIGLNFKTLIGQSLTQTGQADLTGTGWEMDAGLFHRFSSWLDIGIAGFNLLPYQTFGGGAINWNRGPAESVPAYFKTGVTAKIVGDVRSPIYLEDNKFMVTGDLEFRRKNTLFHLGTEWAVLDTYAFRGGLSQAIRQGEIQLDPSIGFGYRASEWQFDLAVGKEPTSGDGSVYLSAGYFPSSWLFMAKPVESITLFDGAETFKPSLEVSGKVRPEVILSINPGTVEVRPNGDFSGSVILITGENTVTVTTDYADEKQSTAYNVVRKKHPQIPAAIKYPPDNQVIFEDSVDLSGQLSKDVQALYIDNQPVLLDEGKNFRKTIPLKMGKNTINLEGKYDDYSVSSILTVVRKPPPPKPKEVAESPEEKAKQKALIEKAKREAEALARQEALAKQEILAQQEALAKQEAEALAQQEALAKQKVEREALAQQKAEQEELARQKAEQEALVKQEALAKKKAEREALAKQKAEQEELARQNAEQEALVQQEVETLAQPEVPVQQKVKQKVKAKPKSLARKKAEQEALAIQKAKQEADALARQEVLANRKARQVELAIQKAEQEELARQEALAKQKAKQEALAKQKAEQEELARQKALAKQEALAKKKAKQEALARQKAEQEELARQKVLEKIEAIKKEKAEIAAKEAAKKEEARIAEERERNKMLVESFKEKVPTVEPWTAEEFAPKPNPEREKVLIENFARFSYKENDIWNALQAAGYIDKNGKVQDKFDGNRDHFNLNIPLTPEEKNKIFNILFERPKPAIADIKMHKENIKKRRQAEKIIKEASKEAGIIIKRAKADQAKFEKLQQLIAESVNLTIIEKAKIKLPKGYLSVYSLSDGRYLALKHLGKGKIAIDLYISNLGKWSTIAYLPYSKVKDLI